MRLRIAVLFLFLLSPAFTLPAFADSIPYNRVGQVATQVATYATTAGINAYFYGSTASYNDTIEIVDLNTGYDTGAFFPNHSTTNGAVLTIGNGSGQIKPGDQLVLYINSPAGKFASVASKSTDGVNHAYVTTYSGGTVGGTIVPPGLFVGMEDLAASNADFNYNDETLILTGISAPSLAPEPNSLVLLGTGLLTATALLRRKRARG